MKPVAAIESAGAAAVASARPLVVHVVHRFDVGGLENGVVNLVNQMPSGAYRHAVLALTEATDFGRRIWHADAPVIALHKRPGQTLWLYPALFRLMRRLRPAIVHSRNLAALETLVPAWAAGVPVRIHGEHGRDIDDLDGSNRKYQRLRRVYRPFVSHYVSLNRELTDYLVARVGVPVSAISQICNGVDTSHFNPGDSGAVTIPGCPFDPRRHWLVGTVGRMQAVKDQLTLTRAFVIALQRQPPLRQRMRLVMIGDGPLRAQSLAVLEAAAVSDLAWLPGERNDVAELMRGLCCFVLPSLAEGVSNTILEAMASGLPVIATSVGANAELVRDGETGRIVPPADAGSLAAAMIELATEPERALAMGRAGRRVVEARFSLRSMVSAYQSLYDAQLRARGAAADAATHES